MVFNNDNYTLLKLIPFEYIIRIMNRREFVGLSGSVITSGYIIGSISRAAFGVNFSLTSNEITISNAEVDSININFSEFLVTTKNINLNNPLQLKIKAGDNTGLDTVLSKNILIDSESQDVVSDIGSVDISKSDNIPRDFTDYEDGTKLEFTIEIQIGHDDIKSKSTTEEKLFINVSDVVGNPDEDSETGLYTISTSNYSQDIFFDMENDGGDWMLVASNYRSDDTIPNGTSRYNTQFEINRPGYEDALIGNSGISPSGDYIIGPILDEINWSEVRVVGWDRNNTSSNNTYEDAMNLNVNNRVKGIWSVSDGSTEDKLKEKQNLNNVDISTYNTSIYESRIDVFYADGIKTATSNSNENQVTIGGAGRTEGQVSTWFGHGSDGNSEGWYNSSGNHGNSLGWATFVR